MIQTLASKPAYSAAVAVGAVAAGSVGVFEAAQTAGTFISTGVLAVGGVLLVLIWFARRLTNAVDRFFDSNLDKVVKLPTAEELKQTHADLRNERKSLFDQIIALSDEMNAERREVQEVRRSHEKALTEHRERLNALEREVFSTDGRRRS